MKLLRPTMVVLTGMFAVAVLAAERINLGWGTLELPEGFKHARDQGIDTLVGHFTSTDTNLVVHYDIGALAGVYATNIQRDLISLTETNVGNIRTFIAVHGIAVHGKATNRVVISFPEGGPANFYADIRGEIDLEAVKRLVLSFRLNPVESKH